MVLRCDETLVGADTPHRLVVATVSVFQLICSGTGCLGEELVAHAYSAYGFAYLYSLADILYSFLCHVGIARTVGDEQPVIRYDSEVIVPGHTYHFHSSTCQAADNIMLDTAVNKHHCLVTLSVMLYFLTGDFGHEIFLIGVVEPDISSTIDDNLAEH